MVSVVFASNAFVITNDSDACQGIPRTPGYTERCDYLNGLILFLLGVMCGGLLGIFLCAYSLPVETQQRRMSEMRHRNNLLQLWLSDEEMKTLRDNSLLCGKTMSAYVRCILDGFRPVETPPLDYYNLLREVRRVGYNMRQIAQRAYTLNMVDAPQYDEDAKRILNLCDDLTMICLPRGEKL